jgi:hypothetical protein
MSMRLAQYAAQQSASDKPVGEVKASANGSNASQQRTSELLSAVADYRYRTAPGGQRHI